MIASANQFIPQDKILAEPVISQQSGWSKSGGNQKSFRFCISCSAVAPQLMPAAFTNGSFKSAQQPPTNSSTAVIFTDSKPSEPNQTIVVAAEAEPNNFRAVNSDQHRIRIFSTHSFEFIRGIFRSLRSTRLFGVVIERSNNRSNEVGNLDRLIDVHLGNLNSFFRFINSHSFKLHANSFWSTYGVRKLRIES